MPGFFESLFGGGSKGGGGLFGGGPKGGSVQEHSAHQWSTPWGAYTALDGPDGVRHLGAGDTQAEADARAAQAQRQADDGSL